MQRTTTQAIGIFRVAIFALICSICMISDAKSRGPVISLDEDSWTQLLNGEWMVDFYAPWCPACRQLEPEWAKLAEWSDDLNIKVASADVTANPGLSGRFMVSGLPTIYHVKDGIFRPYTGSRDHKAMIIFIENQKWKSIEPISRWRAPDTFQMSFVAHSFRISMALRDVHNYLVEEVGLPYYISYLIFALCTVTLGIVLALVIVFVVDRFIPPRQSSAAFDTRASAARRKKTDKSDDSDLDDDHDSKEANKGNSETERLRKRN